MKFFTNIALLFSFLIAFNSYAFADAQVQIIHNCADPAASVVDVYVNGQKLSQLDDLGYKEATPYVPIPAGIDVVVTIASQNSTNVTDGVIQTFNLGQLVDNKEYVVIASGVVGEGFNAGDEGREIAFDLKVVDGKRLSGNPTQISVSIFHGVTDAPAVDVYIAKNTENYTETPQVSNLNYAASTEFLNLSAGFYKIRVTVAGDKDAIVGDYSAPLTTAAGLGAVVVATGFVSPEDEMGGLDASTYGFNLLAIAPQGFVIPLPQLDFASVQLIHNSADPAAAVVDVYINGLIMANDLEFRKATTLLPIVAGEAVNVSINGPNSTNSSEDVVKTFTLPSLEENGEYVVMVSGMASSEGFNAGDEGRDILLSLYSSALKSERDNNESLDINVFHGVTDAPAVDIYADIEGDALVSNLNYGEFTGLVNIPSDDYVLTVTAAGNKEVVVGEYIAPLSAPLGNITVFASGFLSPEDEGDGLDEDMYGFGIFAALSNGLVVELEKVEIGIEEYSYVQIIHNSPDPAASMVDLYVNGSLVEDDFSFRQATEYIPFIVGAPVTVSINLPTSTSIDDGVVGTFTLPELIADGGLVVVANGVVGEGFNTGAEGRDIAFNLEMIEVVEEYDLEGNTLLNVFHGSTDAPAVDVYINDENTPTISNLDYAGNIGWTELAAEDIRLTVTAAGNTEVVVNRYDAPLSLFSDDILFVMASGFLTSGDEPGGSEDQDFGLFAVDTEGNVVELSIVNSVDKELSLNTNLYPNPAINSISLDLNGAVSESYKIYNSNSKLILENNEVKSNLLNINVSELNTGVYYITVETDKGKIFKKFVVN